MGLRPRPAAPPSDRENMTLDTLPDGPYSGSITPKGPASPPSDRESMTLDTLPNGHCSGSTTPKGPASSPSDRESMTLDTLPNGHCSGSITPEGPASPPSDRENMTLDTLPNGHYSGSITPKGPASSSCVVQKFGGTSVGKFAREIITNVIKPSLVKNHVAVVCSAISATVKADGTTNRLLQSSKKAPAAGSHSFRKLIEDVRFDHIALAESHIKGLAILAHLKNHIDEECTLITRILEASQTLGEISPRSRDKVMSAGEKLSCRFIAALLQDQGVDSEYVDLSKVIDFETDGRLNQQFYDHVARNIANRLQGCGSKIPVITGYFGPVPGGLLEKVGRGYTDLCAALVAVGIGATELQVWKEVDGIFTADPRKVPTASLLPQISPAEASELTFYGSEVIHPFTMEQAIRARIPIRIKNVMNPRGSGTIIFPDSPTDIDEARGGLQPKLFRSRSATVLPTKRRGPKRPTAVTVKHKIMVINVHSNKRSLSHGFFANIFSTLDKWRLSIDLISTSEVHVSMALHSEAPLYDGVGEDDYRITDKDLESAIEELGSYGKVDILPEMAILSLVGKQMRNMVGIAGKMFSTLGENNVNIEMISQGASEINISCVIEERDADRAINILHTNLFTFLE